MSFDFKNRVRGNIKRIVAPYRRFKFAELKEVGGVKYIHRHPKVFNIGDFLCSPRHYFSFSKPIDGLIITGGGIYTDRDLGYLSSLGFPLRNMVLWGAGESLRQERAFESMNHGELLDWGRRDLARVEDDTRFLPCVSCLLPFLDERPAGEGTLLLLNADPEVTKPIIAKEIQALADSYGWRLLWNSCKPEELRRAYLATDKIISNSYHASYWGLLSGRHVKTLGYSSKFESLRYCLGLPEGFVMKHEKGSSEFLLSLLRSGSLKNDMAYLSDHKTKLKEFRKRNLDFAQRLVIRGAISGYRKIDVY